LTTNSSSVCEIENIAQGQNKTNIIKININSSDPFLQKQILSIVIDNFINPSNPQNNYTFGVETYYDQNDSLSMVQNNSKA
jgi:hypothetical protein